MKEQPIGHHTRLPDPHTPLTGQPIGHRTPLPDPHTQQPIGRHTRLIEQRIGHHIRPPDIQPGHRTLQLTGHKRQQAVQQETAHRIG